MKLDRHDIGLLKKMAEAGGSLVFTQTSREMRAFSLVKAGYCTRDLVAYSMKTDRQGMVITSYRNRYTLTKLGQDAAAKP